MTHLHTKSSVPMSISNYDRHGLANLAHDPVKPLDRWKIPPYMVYMCIFSIFAFYVLRTSQDKGLNIETLRRENMLKAMRANREKLVYDAKTEISPAEQIHMKSQQYTKVVKERTQAEKDTINDIKRNFLHPETGDKGPGNRTIDIKKLIELKPEVSSKV